MISALTLLGTFAVWLTSGSAEAQTEVARNVAKKLLTAANDWKQDHSQLGCPTLSQLIVDNNWDRSTPAEDPWGGRFVIMCSDDGLEVRSPGVDGRFDTADDISLHAPWNS